MVIRYYGCVCLILLVLVGCLILLVLVGYLMLCGCLVVGDCVLIMVIVNCILDLFYDKGVIFSDVVVRDVVYWVVVDGVDVIDVGGVKVGLGECVDVDIEIMWLVLFIEWFCGVYLD